MMTYNFDQNQIFLLILAVFILILLIWNTLLHLRFKRLIRGSNKKSIEDSLINIFNYIERSNNDTKKLSDSVSVLQNKFQKSPRGFALVNFKAFDGIKSGGSNSFALSFVNDEGNGIVLSTFHARDRVNVFSKKIDNFKCEVMLTEEEQQALDKARVTLGL